MKTSKDIPDQVQIVDFEKGLEELKRSLTRLAERYAIANRLYLELLSSDIDFEDPKLKNQEKRVREINDLVLRMFTSFIQSQITADTDDNVRDKVFEEVIMICESMTYTTVEMTRRLYRRKPFTDNAALTSETIHQLAIPEFETVEEESVRVGTLIVNALDSELSLQPDAGFKYRGLNANRVREVIVTALESSLAEGSQFWRFVENQTLIKYDGAPIRKNSAEIFSTSVGSAYEERVDGNYCGAKGYLIEIEIVLRNGVQTPALTVSELVSTSYRSN